MVKEEFIIGKWYTYNNWYVKLGEISKDNTFIASESIDPSGHYRGRLKVHPLVFSGWAVSLGPCDFRKKLITDLSIISPYLPKNYPDLLTINEIILW